MWVRGPKRRRDFQGLCSAAGKCSGFGGFRQSSSRPSLFLLLWSGARGFGRESTRGKLLLHGRQALWCWTGVWVCAEASCASVRDQPEPCSSWPGGGEKTTQILQDCFPQLRFSSLFALRSIRGRRCASKPWWSLPAGISAAPVQGCKSEGCKSEQGDPLLAVGSWSQSALKLVFARVAVEDGSSMFAVLPGWGETPQLCCGSRHPFLHQEFAKAQETLYGCLGTTGCSFQPHLLPAFPSALKSASADAWQTGHGLSSRF